MRQKLFQIMIYKFNISKSVLLCALTFFCLSKINSQNEFRLGLKLHPNLSFSNLIDKSNFDDENFTARNGLLGFNFGIIANYQYEKWIFEISTGLKTNSTGIIFKNEQNSSQLNLRTISFYNEINIGHQIFKSNLPYYEIFLVPSISYNLVAMQRINSKGTFSQVSQYEQIYPSINETWNSMTLGIGLKIRTQLKNMRRFDYDLSYRYGFKKYPPFGMIVTIDNQIYQSLVRPNIQTLNIDFIYYFGKRNN